MPPAIRPLPSAKASVASPKGHHTQKPRTATAIQAGLPNSSILATTLIRASK